LPRRGAPLVAEFSRGVFKRRLRVPKTIAAIGASELAININSHSSFSRTWARVVGREDAGCRGSNDEGFRFCEKTKRDANGFGLRREERGFPVERIHENAAESCGGKREKMAAAHVRECSRGTRARHVRGECRRAML
jgi:hypothetical protein